MVYTIDGYYKVNSQHLACQGLSIGQYILSIRDVWCSGSFPPKTLLFGLKRLKKRIYDPEFPDDDWTVWAFKSLTPASPWAIGRLSRELSSEPFPTLLFHLKVTLLHGLGSGLSKGGRF